MESCHISNVRGSRQTKLSGKKADCKELADASQSGATGLDVVQRTRLHKILEYNAIRNVFSSRDFHRCNLSGQHDMSILREQVVSKPLWNSRRLHCNHAYAGIGRCLRDVDLKFSLDLAESEWPPSGKQTGRQNSSFDA